MREQRRQLLDFFLYLHSLLSKMSVHVAEKKGSTLKGSNHGMIATSIIDNENGDRQNGQNIMVFAQDPQGKELITLTDNQTISVTIDTYCSYTSWIHCFVLKNRLYNLINVTFYSRRMQIRFKFAYIIYNINPINVTLIRLFSVIFMTIF